MRPAAGRTGLTGADALEPKISTCRHRGTAVLLGCCRASGNCIISACTVLAQPSIAQL